jgi:AraC-like DNA-binding protein
VDRWQQALSAANLPWTVAIPGAPHLDGFGAWIRRQWIDDIALVEVECGPCSGARTRHQLADTDGEFVGILIVRAGAETTVQDGIEATITPGDGLAWDSTKPARFTSGTPVSKRSLLIPRAALEEVSGSTRVTGGVKLDRAAPAVIASAHAVSIRTVHRVFSATGQTVGEVVRLRRLARARDDLTSGARPISAIAHRWGFYDTSHFSRTFKARYGSSPADYRNAARQVVAPVSHQRRQ